MRIFISTILFVSLAINVYLWSERCTRAHRDRTERGTGAISLQSDETELASEASDEMEASGETTTATTEKLREAQFPIRYLQRRESLIFQNDFALVPEIASALDVSEAQNAAFAVKAAVRFNEIRELEKQSRLAMEDDHGAYHRIPLDEEGKQRVREALQADAVSVLGDEAGRALGSLLPYDFWFGQDEGIDVFPWYIHPKTGVPGYAIRRLRSGADGKLLVVSSPALVHESWSNHEYRRFSHLMNATK